MALSRTKLILLCCTVFLLTVQVVADKEPHEDSKEDDSVSEHLQKLTIFLNGYHNHWFAIYLG